jgi:hypothetical protein
VLSDDGVTRVIYPSPSGYAALFHRGQVITEEGDTLDVGTIQRGHGHAHDPMSTIALVRCGDDPQGGWVAGSLVDTATEADAALLRRSHLSGEWQDMGERGIEMRALAAVASGATVMMKTFLWGVSPALRRQELERLRNRDPTSGRRSGRRSPRTRRRWRST